MIPILALLLADIADLAVINAKIYTVDARQPSATALAVKGGRLTAVGNDVRANIGPNTKVIDAKGAAVIPGLIDSHVHLAGLGFQLETFDLRSVNSIEEVAAIVRKAAATKKPGEWVLGRSWDQTNWGGKFPTAEPLTKAAPNHPVSLNRVDGHAIWVNKRALELAKITKATPDPSGGKIERDASGEPTGVLIDKAMGLVTRVIPPPSAETLKRRLELAAKECARLGLTTVHDAGIDAQTLAAYRALLKEHNLPLRIYAMIGGEGSMWREFLNHGPEINERITVRSIKLVADGAMGSRGAAFFQPYADDPGNTGLTMLKGEDIERVARDAVKKGFQVNTHAIGDRAVRITLDAYAKALEKVNDNRRFRIEHAQVVSLPDFALFKKWNVIASIQSTHATSDMRWAEKRLGPDRVVGAYAPQRFLKAGVAITNGSDFPVEDPNPMFGLYAAITRQDATGFPESGWYPDQKLTREQALYSWTYGGAFAAFEEKTKGSLTPGKLADFLILSDDIMQTEAKQILKTKIKMTVLGGEVVHTAAE